MPTAIFVDAGFFLKRFPTVYPDKDSGDPVLVARTLHEMALDHLKQRGDADRKDLYRIFVYDCPPLLKKAQYPISARAVDFAKTPTASFRLDFHQQLKCLRKVALRLGRLQDRKAWRIKPHRLRALLRRESTACVPLARARSQDHNCGCSIKVGRIEGGWAKLTH